MPLPFIETDAEVIPWPDTSLLIHDDGEPVDNIVQGSQRQLLTETLRYNFKTLNGKPFQVYSNVGFYSDYKKKADVPDVMLCLDFPGIKGSPYDSDNLSFHTWVVGKLPEVVIEIVTDHRGSEDGDKMDHYRSLPIQYYVIFDPEEKLEGGVLRVFRFEALKYVPSDPKMLGGVGLGLTLWNGKYDGTDVSWLRWTDGKGNVIPTGQEAKQNAIRLFEVEKQKVEVEKQKVEAEKLKVEAEKERAEKAEERIRILEEQLRRQS